LRVVGAGARATATTHARARAMPRYAVVHSDDSDSEGDCTPTDEMSAAADEVSDDDDDADNPLFGTVVEALEFAIRNVPMRGEHLRVADEALTNLRARSSVLFHQALSPRWSPAFVDVLKRARMMRVCFLTGNSSAQLLRDGTRCCMCGAPEPRCEVALQLIGGEDGGVGRCADMTQMSDAFDRQDDLNRLLCVSHEDEAFLGTYAGGRRCFDLAMAAVLARNLVSDTSYAVYRAIYERLDDINTRDALELDERDSTRALFALTNVRALAAELDARIRVVESVLRGQPFPDSKYVHTGDKAAWGNLRTALSRKFGTDDERRLCYCAGRAADNLRQQRRKTTDTEKQWVCEMEEEEEAVEAPVSSRTRASRQQHRQAAPVSSRTRRAGRVA